MNESYPAVCCVNSFQLKLIALLAMTIDHLAAVMGFGYGTLYWVMRGIGRIAFPIYCFLLVEGFLHTRSRRRYLLELLLFFVLSEPIYDHTMNLGWVDWSNQNVMLTLVIGLGTLWAVECVPEWCRKWMPNADPSGGLMEAARVSFQLLTVLIGCVAAEYVLMADYGFGGVALIAVFYLFRRKPVQLCLAVGVVMCVGINLVETPGLLALVPILLYNGQRAAALRGKSGKYFFYLYYPLHITVLALLGRMLG